MGVDLAKRRREAGIRGVTASPSGTASIRASFLLGTLLGTRLEHRFRWRSDRLKGGLDVIVRIRFVAAQRNWFAVQVLSGHVARIDQRLMTIGLAPRC